jgi:hypothetical protein
MTRPRRSSEQRSRCPPTTASSPDSESADRGLSPVVGKTLELGVGVLFVALLTATFFGAVAPDYRAAVGSELGDRTLTAAADRIEAAVPGTDYSRVDRNVTVRLPETIRGDPYRIVADGGVPAVRLVHPDRTVGGRLRLDLPRSATVSGSWRSTSPSRVVVDGAGGNVSVRLVDGVAEGDADGSARTAPREGSV